MANAPLERTYYVTSIYVDLLRRIIKQKRLLIVIGVFAGVFGVLLLLSEPFAYRLSNMFQVDLLQTPAPIFLVVLSFVSFSLLYLQSGGTDGSDTTNPWVLESINRLRHTDATVEKLSKKLAELQQQIEQVTPSESLTSDERQAAIASVVSQVGETTIKAIFQDQTTAFLEDVKKGLSFDRLTALSRNIVERLHREIDDLRLRSNINLLIGMSITAGGLYLLWSTVTMVDSSQLLRELASQGDDSNTKFLKNLILPIAPRILLIIFVEVFAYFFLRLYKNGLSEIKYFQNELTNIESKLVAVEFAFITNSQDSLKASLEALSHTERNFVLEKGQTTVELEKAKSESDLTRNIIKTIPRLFTKTAK